MKNGWTLCVLVSLVSAAWAADQAPKKFHTSGSPPHHSVAKFEKSERARQNAGNPMAAKPQVSRNQELDRLEHQRAVQVHGQIAKSSRPGTASHVRAESA